jgi:hypothetical protein
VVIAGGEARGEGAGEGVAARAGFAGDRDKRAGGMGGATGARARELDIQIGLGLLKDREGIHRLGWAVTGWPPGGPRPPYADRAGLLAGYCPSMRIG